MDLRFEVHLADFLLATCFYSLPNMLMIVSVYSLISLLFKSPLPTVPLLLLYMVYSMFFVIIFSLVRGVTYFDEIGITIGF